MRGEMMPMVAVWLSKVWYYGIWKLRGERKIKDDSQFLARASEGDGGAITKKSKTRCGLSLRGREEIGMENSVWD